MVPLAIEPPSTRWMSSGDGGQRFEEIEPQCLVDLNRFAVEGMAAQIPKIGVLGALGGSAASLSPPPAQRWVQANFADLEGGGAIGDR